MDKRVLIIGAGPAGLIAAGNLLQNDISVTIVEKSQFPRIVVGESLLPISIEHFEKIGVLEALKKRNYKLKPGAQFVKEMDVRSFDFTQYYTKDSKTWTWQVPRADFDQVIANEIIKKGGEILFNSSIESISWGSKVSAKINNEGISIDKDFDFVFDASGAACVLPKMLNLPTKKQKINTFSLFTHVTDTKRHLNQIIEPETSAFEIIKKDLWAWYIPITDDTTSIGIVGHDRHLENADETLSNREIIEQYIANSRAFGERFSPFETKFEPKLMKGYSQHTTTLTGDQFALIGSSFEFIDPVFSSGVAMATSSAIKASDTLIESFKNEQAPRWDDYENYVKSGGQVFRKFVEAWYDGKLSRILFTSEQVTLFKKQICSVLAGYVWDQSNPFVSKTDKAITKLDKVTQMKKKYKKARKTVDVEG